MKRTNLKNRPLIVVPLVICAVFYLFLSVGNFYLHNHNVDGRHHNGCPSCEFLTVASFFNVPEIEFISFYLCQVTHVLILDDKCVARHIYDQLFSGRPPPTIL